jgi:hypothetical protein
LVGWHTDVFQILPLLTAERRSTLQARQPKLPFTGQDQVAMSRASWPSLVGSMLPTPHPLYARIPDQPAKPIPDPRTRSNLNYTMAIIIIDLPYAFSFNNYTVWYRYFSRYHHGEITPTRRFRTYSTCVKPFQGSRPPRHAVPIAVLRETPTLLRCCLSTRCRA